MSIHATTDYPVRVIENGLPTKFLRNKTEAGTFEIIQIMEDGLHKVLFSGTERACEEFSCTLSPSAYSTLPGSPRTSRTRSL